MHVVEILVAAGWAVFWIYWLASALSMKRGRVPWSRAVGIRLVIVGVVVVLARFRTFRHHGANADPWLAAVGMLLFVGGLSFAVWARVHIGRNWGVPMTEKDDPELITTGPYRLVRHPIYSGILIAILGTAVAINWLGLIAFVLAGIYFVYSAFVEERFLATRLPDTYPAYQRSTKMLVPFIY
jgi:protein-S-isoprenylcysteine O-methyltransferase Ste14